MLRPILLGMLSSLWDRASLYQRLYNDLPDRAQQALAKYKNIYADCQAGDAVAASRGVREYIHQAAEEIVEKLEANQL